MCGAAAMREPRVLYDRWRGGGGEVATEELERGAERAAAARPRATDDREPVSQRVGTGSTSREYVLYNETSTCARALARP